MFKGIFKRKKVAYVGLMLGAFCVFGKCYAASYATSTISDSFPASYQSYINRLKSSHPNWNIKAFYTHLDWNTVLNSESKGTYSRVQNSAYGDAWKRTEAANDSSYNAAGFVLASRAAVAYTLDPRNFLTDEGIFQFRVIDKDVASDTETAVKEVAHSTPMYTNDYASIIKKVGNDKNIAPTFIISRIRQETGCDTVNNGSINGKNSKYPGYYNFFNIGARDGNGAVQAGINLAYTNGWNTPEKAIAGGMDWLNKNYVKYGQSTVYFQKFDVANPYGNATTLLSMQYMSNISAPMGEAKIAYKGIERAGILNNTYTFYIPIYDNMPSIASPSPTIGYYENDSTMVYLDDPDTNDSYDIFKIRSTADSSSSSNIVYTLKESSDINKKTAMRRIKKGIDTGWDYVEFEVNGQKIEGYVWNYYVFEYSYTKVTAISLDTTNKTLKVGDTFKLSATVEPMNAKFKDVTWSSSNNNILTVDSSGNVKGVAAGSAVITATTKDQQKTATCIVTVTDKDPSIFLDKTKYSVVIGKLTPFSVNIEYTDVSDYDVKIEDENIAKIQDGKILGVKEGTTKLIITLKGTNIKAEAEINVIDIKEGDIVIDSSLDVNNDVVSNISPETKAQDIIGKVQSSYTVALKNKSGETLTGDACVGTGSKIQILDNAGTAIYEYAVLIYGDVTGDGKITSKDYMAIKNHIMGTAAITGVEAKAADSFRDNNITSKDYMIIKNHIMGTSVISQK